MIEILHNRTFARLFSAQIVALLGTGLLTVALGLLAFDIAGGNAGLVLGTALTIKMVAYVAVSPVMVAVLAHLPRKSVLIAADVIRAVIALSLPFVTEAWQIYLLVFVLQSASATFTPTFQAVIPEVLTDERDYTRALSLSRMAYDLESLASPVIAAALLTIISYHELFMGTVAGFAASALLVIGTRLPDMPPSMSSSFVERLTRGVRVFARSAELRSLLAMNLVVASATAMVIVNTVVLVKDQLERADSDVAILLALYGAGSMMVAILAPRLLDRLSDRTVMLTGTIALPLTLGGVGVVLTFADPIPWVLLLSAWFILGAATSLVLTPSARLLRRASDDTTRPAVFSAQFSLSHASFMITYPLAGAVGAALGLAPAAFVLATLAAAAAILAVISARAVDRHARTRVLEQ
jgi:predicted MFS family arabinose efflux permease